MKQDNHIIAVKNMICSRCIKVLKEELSKHDIDFVQVDLGIIEFEEKLSDKNYKKLKTILNKEGFDLIEDKETLLVNKIKTLIIKNIHYQGSKPEHQNFSEFISKKIGVGYSHLSKLFSELEQKTIEHFIIEQKIERVKELLLYGELSLSQISYDLNYSSPQHLSRQFKQTTGLTPTQFIKTGKRNKLDLL